MSFLGILSNECSMFLDMMNDIGFDKKQPLYIIKKMINIAIRATYCIFCCRNRNWDSPDNAILNNSKSSSICQLPIHSEIYNNKNCTFKNTNKVSIIIIIIIIIN